MIPGDFGEIGAVLVENEHSSEIYLQHIILDGLPNGPIRFHCGSWIEPKSDNSRKRLFFTNKVSDLPQHFLSSRKHTLPLLEFDDSNSIWSNSKS